jgi:hypothetical protein
MRKAGIFSSKSKDRKAALRHGFSVFVLFIAPMRVRTRPAKLRLNMKYSHFSRNLLLRGKKCGPPVKNIF